MMLLKGGILMYKRLTMILLSVCLIAVMALSCTGAKPSETPATPSSPQAPTTPTAAGPVQLKWGHQDPPTAYLSIHMVDAWADAMEKASGNQIEITTYPGQQLFKVADTYDALVAGTTDFAWCLTGIKQGGFPLSEIMAQPFMPIPSALVGSQVQYELYQKFPEMQAEYPDIKLMTLMTTDSYFMMSRDKPIRKLEDLKGMTVRVFGPIASETIKALGATPVAIPMPELYQSMQKGVVDAVATMNEPIAGQKLAEVCKYCTKGLHMFASTCWMGANQQMWDKLPADVQNSIWECCAEKAGARFPGDGWGPDCEKAALEEMEKNNVEIITISPEEEQRWRAACQGFTNGYIADLEAKGLPAQAVYDEALRLLAEYSK